MKSISLTDIATGLIIFVAVSHSVYDLLTWWYS